MIRRYERQAFIAPEFGVTPAQLKYILRLNKVSLERVGKTAVVLVTDEDLKTIKTLVRDFKKTHRCGGDIGEAMTRYYIRKSLRDLFDKDKRDGDARGKWYCEMLEEKQREYAQCGY